MAKNHFFEQGFRPHKTYLKPRPWGRVRDVVVRGTADMLVVQRGQILLGKRAHEPQAGWWIFGGGINPGESFEEAAARNFKRELGISINPERFQYLDVYNYVWATRAEPPEGHGCHDVSITMVLEISDEEVAQIRTNEEYSETSWLRPEAIVANGGFHPALRQMARDLIKFRKGTAAKIYDLLKNSARRRLPKWTKKTSAAT